jgi:quaternary ammonium compound-resistance protein SugE
MTRETIGWLLVLAAGCLEVLWPILMKQSQQCQGSARAAWLGLMMATMCASFGLLSWAVGQRFRLPIGTAYAVWTGLGAAGAATIGILLFREPRDAGRLVFLSLIIAGIVGLKVTHRSDAPTAHSATPVASDRPAVDHAGTRGL